MIFPFKVNTEKDSDKKGLSLNHIKSPQLKKHGFCQRLLFFMQTQTQGTPHSSRVSAESGRSLGVLAGFCVADDFPGGGGASDVGGAVGAARSRQEAKEVFNA